MHRLISPLMCLLLVPAVGLAAPARPARDARVWTAAEAARGAQLALLKEIVNIDSGTGDVEGGKRVATVLIPELKALGANVERVPAEAPGLPDNLVATLKGSGRGRILMIGHMDTVFGPGTVARRSYREDGERLRGPGVGDEKGGVVEGLYALKLLQKLGDRNFGEITFLIETSEERGSPGTTALIRRLLATADVELNLEPGDPPDALTVWRKGSATFHIIVKGRAAHAGMAPQEGRNAAVELIHQLKGLDAYPRSGSGTTVNLTILKAGSRNNIIPEDAEAEVNVRVRENRVFDDVEAALRHNAQTHEVPDTVVTVTRDPAFPPLPENPATQALAARAQAIYAGIDRKVSLSGNGGASESALAAEAGVPALDGLGPVGGGFHSDAEYVDAGTVTPRLYLLTKLLMDLGARPPAKGH